MSYPDNTVTQTVTVGAGASLSGSSSKYAGLKLVGVVTAATWDAAKLTFAVSVDGTNFYPLKDAAGTEYEISAQTAAMAIAVEPKNFIAWDYVKVRSGTSTAATNQVDATIVTLVFMPI